MQTTNPMGKRGISPLIATVILIAFAVSLGAVVMNLGSKLVGGTITDQKECSGMTLKFHELNGPQVSFGGSGTEGFIEFVADHTGTEPIPKVRMRVIGQRAGSTEACVIEVSNSVIDAGNPFSKRVPYNFDTCGTPKQVELVPIAMREKKELPCQGGIASYTVP